MDADRWKKVEQICYEAESLDKAERDTYLQHTCGSDTELLKEVKSLLSQADSEHLREPFVDVESSFVFSRDESVADCTFGPYRVIKTLGTGGMGQVYLAVRNDKEFERFVALKIIRKGTVSDEILRRFYEERQILASLSHPNIARLFDGGTTQEGIPWFAMEYIEGLSITEYCKKRDLSTDEKINLFQKVCSAVQYAHSNLVIHRDLKPANIIITSDGTPKLLDFGIAKLKDLEQKAGQMTPQNQMMTPEYASPEQVRNEAISTASDVYSLGIILYELLTDELPYEFEQRSPGAIKQIICNTIPTLPSSVSGDKKLKGDLDNIILKALQKKPTERYTSTEQLSNDLNRYQKFLPIAARKQTVSYRAGKFLSRHKWSTATSAAVSLLIIAFSVITFIQSKTIEARAIEAELERDRAEQVSTFLTDLFESVDPNEAENQSLSAIELLHRGAERVETELDGQPIQQANVYLVISDVYESLGLFDRGLELAEKAYTLQQNLFEGSHREIARSLNSMGWLYRQKGDYEMADSLLTAGLKMRRELFGSNDLDVSRSLNDLAVLKQSVGDYAATDTLLKEAIEIRKKLAGSQNESVGTALSNYGALKYSMGDMPAAVDNMRESLQIFQATVGNQDMRTANVMTNLAAILSYQGDFKNAEPLYRDALDIRIRLLGEEHPDVALSYAHLGNLLRFEGQFEEAEINLLKALELREKLLGENHAITGDSKRVLGYLYKGIEDYKKAETYYSGALKIFKETYPDGHPEIAEVMHSLGEVSMEMNNPMAAEPRFREAKELYEQFFGEDDSRTIRSMIMLGICLSQTGNGAEAKELLTSALSLYGDQERNIAAFKTLAENTLSDL